MYSHNEILYCIVVPSEPLRLSRVARSWIAIRGKMVNRNPSPDKKSVKASGAGLRFSDFRFPRPEDI